jgi:hypothetical protein
VVLLAAFGSGRSEPACAHEPTPEGAPSQGAPSHKRGCSCGERQRHNECVGLAAARIGDDLTAGREQLPIAGLPGLPDSPAKGTEPSEAPLPEASTAGPATASSVSTNPTSVTAEPAGSAAGHARTACGTDRSDNP